tara:strand:+ start:16983 stop:18368 length:1386 start_codon:yes stop_codon:yes gene_type:complete
MAKSKSSVRASLIEMWTRLTDYDPKEKVHLNGDDNQYPDEIEVAINNSPSGSRASNMLAKYISGQEVLEDTTLNEVNMDKKSDLVRAISVDISKQNGCFIHVGYSINDKGELYTVNPKVLNYKRCRIAKEDDLGYAGKIVFKDFRKDKSLSTLGNRKNEEAKWYYPYNNKQNVIISQIRNDAKLAGKDTEDISVQINNYRGQVYYLNLTPQYVYAVSLFDSVYNDLDTEYRMGLYTNSTTRAGFLGKLAVITSGIDDEQIAQVDSDIQNWLGAENSSSVFRLDVETTDNISEVLEVKQLTTQYDEKQFSETRMNARSNIFGAANNIPESLVMNSNSLFGQSGEAYIQLKEFYSEQTKYERDKVEQAMNHLGFPTVIIPIGEVAQEEGADEVDVVTTDPETLAAQAGLRGSVGGVTGILGIQAGVNSGTTAYESAVTILKEIYGFTDKVSRDLLGENKTGIL